MIIYIVDVYKRQYPDSTKTNKENENIMMEKNYEVWKKIYEDFYKTPLVYLNEMDENEEK